MNIYDYAHGLAKAIKASSQYKQFREACDKLEKDASAKEMLQDFRKNQWELEKQKLSGLEVSSPQEEKLKRMLEVINLNLTVKEYMDRAKNKSLQRFFSRQRRFLLFDLLFFLFLLLFFIMPERRYPA